MTEDRVLIEWSLHNIRNSDAIYSKQSQWKVGVEFFQAIAENKQDSQEPAESCELIHNCVESSRIELKKYWGKYA